MEELKLCANENTSTEMTKVECLNFPKAEDCIYTACYCEENVWQLCNYIRMHQPFCLEHVFAVFLSNDCRIIPLWEQKSGSGDEKIVFWDYHVILLYQKNPCCLVYDLDTRLEFPCDLNVYIQRALRSDHLIMPKYHRKLRVIPSIEFLEQFSSDRSHMKNSDGTWIKPPPEYPAICPKGSSNLDEFIEMDRNCGYGKVMTLNEFAHEHGVFS